MNSNNDFYNKLRSSEDLSVVEKRARIIDGATDSEHAAELLQFPDLLAAPRVELPAVVPAPPEGSPSADAEVTDFPTAQPQQALTAKERMKAEALATIAEIYEAA